MKHEWTFPCKLGEKYGGAYDGDTVYLTIDRGFGDHKHIAMRMDGIDAPEMRGGTELTRRLAQEATAFVLEMCKGAEELVFHSTVWAGKYGRPVGKLYADGVDVGQALIDNNMALPYEGGASRRDHQAQFQMMAEAHYT